MKKAIVWLSLMTTLAAQAQPDTTSRWQHTGYTNHTEMGMMIGQAGLANSTSTTKSNFTITSFNGYRLHRSLAVGISVGIDLYATWMMLPISLGLRGDVWAARRVVPFYALDIGYGSPVLLNRSTSLTKGGVHFNPAIGLRFRNGYGNAFTWSVGLKKQDVANRIDFGNGQYLQNQYHYNRLTVRMGMSF